jgi:hypothetical protein
MGKKAGKHNRELDFDPFDDFGDSYDDEIDIRDLSRDFYSVDQDEGYDGSGRFTARRKIERRRDMKKLYSELDEWEEFGNHSDW